MSEILDNIYIWVFSIKSKNVLLLALVEYILCRYFTQDCIFCTFWMLKILVLWRKNVENLLRFVYLFCPKNGAIDYKETFITQEWLVVEGCPNPCWITFLILYRLVYNIRPHLNQLILAWSAYAKAGKCKLGANAGDQCQGWRPNKELGSGKYKDPFLPHKNAIWNNVWFHKNKKIYGLI